MSRLSSCPKVPSATHLALIVVIARPARKVVWIAGGAAEGSFGIVRRCWGRHRTSACGWRSCTWAGTWSPQLVGAPLRGVGSAAMASGGCR